MTRKAAAGSQQEPGLARTEETEDGTRRMSRSGPKTKARGAETTGPEQGSISEAPREAGSLPPPHPALVELVRLMARADARRARAEAKETR